MPTALPADFLPRRDAFADTADVETVEVFAGRGVADGRTPLLTIAIPTYRRPGTLAEAVESALAQDMDQPFEVVVVDNDPDSDGLQALLRAVPAIADANLRYLRNRENLGMCNNSNRCVAVARGEWISILHDDDLIDPQFGRLMLAELLGENARYDGLVSRKRLLDQRAVQYSLGRVKATVYRARNAAQFRGRASRTIDARKLFWGCVVGNTVGFVCRVSHIREIGGFYPEESPSWDHYFYARFAERFRLGESRMVLATIRAAVNSLTSRSVQLACFHHSQLLQQAYAGSILPAFWARLTPLVLARQVAVTSDFWHSEITTAEAEQSIGRKLPRDRPRLLYAIRLALSGI